MDNIEEMINDAAEASNESIATYLSENIPYDMCKDVLVKPLEPIMIKREFSIPVVKDKVKEDGENISEYDEVTKEIRDVESNFARGIILKTIKKIDGLEWPFNVGDTVVYNKKFSIEFDLFKNSVLVKPYDIIAIEK